MGKPDAVGMSKLPPGPTPITRMDNRTPEIEAIFTLADVDPFGRTEALIWGPPGTGKTVIASTFPPPFRWIDADGGLKSLRWAFKAGKTSLTKLEDLVAYRPIDKEGRYIENPDAFNKVLDMITFWFTEDERDSWNTLVIDSWSALNIWALNLGLSLNFVLPKKEKPLSKSHGINLQAAARLIIGQQDYKSAQALLDDAVEQIRIECATHNKNLVMIAHEWTETSETTNQSGEKSKRIVGYKPALIGNLREKITKDFDEVWAMRAYSKAGAVDIKAQMHKDNMRYAKTRWGSMLDYEEEPDYRTMMKKVREFHSN